MLSEQIVGIERTPKGNYRLHTRVLDYGIDVGKVQDLESKFNNYKAFFQKASKDKSLETYKIVDLRFRGQVVGTKK